MSHYSKLLLLPKFLGDWILNNLNEFKQQYYYKADLIKICRYLKLLVSGTKTELNSYIQDYLDGIPVTQIKFECKRKT